MHSYIEEKWCHLNSESVKVFKDLKLEMNRIWQTKATTIPTIIGIFGQLKKKIGKYIDKIPGNENIQKISVFGAAQTLSIHFKVTESRKYLLSKLLFLTYTRICIFLRNKELIYFNLQSNAQLINYKSNTLSTRLFRMN